MTLRTALLAAAGASAALALASCQRAVQQPLAPATGAPIASLPLAQGLPPSEGLAPAAYELPAAPPLQRVTRARRPVYSYIDDAYWLGDAFADSPPDYTVAYEDEYPWVWRSSNGAYRVVEETPDGWRAYYYYADSDYPFLVRDADYAYAYDGPQLVEVFDAYGRPYANYAPTILDFAARYFTRGRSLYDAAIHEQRRAVYAADWRANRDQVLGYQQQWASAQQRNPDWQAWSRQRATVEPQRQVAWTQERNVRQAYAQRWAPAIAAAPALPAQHREGRGGRNFAAGNEPVHGRDQGRFQAPLPGQFERGAMAQADQGRQQRQAEQAFREQRRFGAEQSRQFQDAQQRQAQLQDRAFPDQGRQAQAALREQRRAEQGRFEQARQQQQLQQRAAEAHGRDAAARQQADQARFAERAQRQQQQEQQQQQARADRAAREQQGRAQQAEAARAGRQQQAMAERAQRDQQAQAMRAQHEQQRQAQAAQQQAQAEVGRHAAEQQQLQAQAQAQAAQQHAQQAQVEAGRRAAEQQQRQAQAQAAQQQHQAQAQAAQQHAQQASAQVGGPHGQGGGGGGANGQHGQGGGHHGKPDK